MLFSGSILPYSPLHPRFIPGLTSQYNYLFSVFGDEGTKNPIRTHGTKHIGEKGFSCACVYISSLTPYLYKKKERREGKSLILLHLLSGLFWGLSKKVYPRIIPVSVWRFSTPLKTRKNRAGGILPC